MIDMVLTNAHTIGIDNCDRSIELQANATELCKLTNNLTQVCIHMLSSRGVQYC